LLRPTFTFFAFLYLLLRPPRIDLGGGLEVGGEKMRGRIKCKTLMVEDTYVDELFIDDFDLLTKDVVRTILDAIYHAVVPHMTVILRVEEGELITTDLDWDEAERLFRELREIHDKCFINTDDLATKEYVRLGRKVIREAGMSLDHVIFVASPLFEGELWLGHKD
jgi:hypothetical protein